jgi:hypothetical protein
VPIHLQALDVQDHGLGLQPLPLRRRPVARQQLAQAPPQALQLRRYLLPLGSAAF